jgi:serine/threonine protein kinase
VSFVGSTIGHIRIESRLGTGGMGEVYLGFDPRLERRVAVKTIRPEQRMSERLKGRFLREARLLSKLGHPSICQVYDLVETPEADFLVLEYVQARRCASSPPRRS